MAVSAAGMMAGLASSCAVRASHTVLNTPSALTTSPRPSNGSSSP
ncbi:hypothetical protein [Streptosporangium canum]